METNYRTNIVKWLPFPNPSLQKWFDDVIKLTEKINRHSRDIMIIIKHIEDGSDCDKQLLELSIENLDELVNNYKDVVRTVHPPHSVYQHRINRSSLILKRKFNVVAKLTRNLVSQVVDLRSVQTLRIVFGLVNKYNSMLDLDHDVTDPVINLFSNDCPLMLQQLKKMSVTRILQILAKNHAEEYCHTLIDCLLANYEPNSQEKLKSPESVDVEMSENSSIEIYWALTKHMTPPICGNLVNEIGGSNVENIQALVNTQTKNVITLVNVVKETSVQLLGSDGIKIKNGEKKIRKNALRKVCEYYQDVAWAAVSSILDHVVLWWSPEGLAARHSQGAYRLKDWLNQLIQAGTDVPATVRPALKNLCDALGCHVTITAWDQLFRSAYVSSFECQSSSVENPLNSGTDTGQMFGQVFQLLVALSNECEIGGEWVVGAPLLELALSEQIILLHRLDHSVHTMRMWAIQESRLIAHTWDLDNFFLLVKSDLVNCLEELSYLKLADHTNSLVTDQVSVQVYVCAKMRAKIVSEVNANINLLKDSPARCVKTLATICRVISLANLHMCFPPSNYWRRRSLLAPTLEPSPYVQIYFDQVLRPVLQVVQDDEISNMILKIMCEAWLDYIYLHRIKFSQLGALQLLTDFAFVTTWVNECSIISQKTRNHLVKNEVLRRCEGVGRLLLRQPGESISMHKLAQKTNENGSPESVGLERMPAEMYVPNQQQWLELRAPKHFIFCCSE